MEEKTPMTINEAARRGGEATRNTYGPEHFATIGRKGGETVRDQRGKEFYESIGRAGGAALLKKHGVEHFRAIGKKGGDKVKAARGAAFYEEIGRAGGQKVKELIEEAQAARAEVEAARSRPEPPDNKNGTTYSPNEDGNFRGGASAGE